MKILNTMQHATTAKLVFGILLSTLAMSAAAHAHSAFAGKFVLPEEVRWNHAVLPAGEYSIEIDSTTAPVVLKSTRSGKAFYTAVPMIAEANKGATSLNITTLGNVRRVRSVNLPRIDKTLIFERLSKTEKEMLAKGGRSESVPVVTARK